VPRQPERQVKIFAFLFSSNGDSVACSRSQAQPETRKAHSSEINSQLKNTLLFLISRRSSGRPTSDELSLPAKQAYDHALTFTISKKVIKKTAFVVNLKIGMLTK
jgi:hypothetical protein